MIALLTVTAFLAGTIDAIAGGGGLITLPALLAAGLPPHLAIATNKGQSVWGAFTSMIAFARAGVVDGRQAVVVFPIGFVGSALGAKLVMLISRDALRPIAIAMLIGAAVLLVLKTPARDDDARPERAGRYLALAAVLAFAIGVYDGFFGPGTGTFLIVGFVALCGKSLVRATADAKVVNFATNLAALSAFAMAGAVEWQLALPMGAGQLAGGLVGARLALRGGGRLIRLAVLVVSGALIGKLAIELA